MSTTLKSLVVKPRSRNIPVDFRVARTELWCTGCWIVRVAVPITPPLHSYDARPWGDRLANTAVLQIHKAVKINCNV